MRSSTGEEVFLPVIGQRYAKSFNKVTSEHRIIATFFHRPGFGAKVLKNVQHVKSLRREPFTPHLTALGWPKLTCNSSSRLCGENHYTNLLA